jgi:hypothetical protein
MKQEIFQVMKTRTSTLLYIVISEISLHKPMFNRLQKGVFIVENKWIVNPYCMSQPEPIVVLVNIVIKTNRQPIAREKCIIPK